MNIENISALMEQLQSLGFENTGYSLLKRISFKPKNFILSQKIEKAKDKLSIQLFFEKDIKVRMWKIPDQYNLRVVCELILLSIFIWSLSSIALPMKEQIRNVS